MDRISGVFKVFQEGERISGIEPVASGHIHHSYKITTSSGKAFLLQQINDSIFRDVEGLMRNIEIVTDHLRTKFEAGTSRFTAALQILKTTEGATFFRDEEGRSWRLYPFIPGSRVYDLMPSDAVAREAGAATGAFMKELSDLEASQLKATLPRFHDFALRYEHYLGALREDPCQRAASCTDAVQFFDLKAPQLLEFNRMILEDVPLRITHNDTKINNILFDEHDRALCLIDLDTVMPGSALHDFGDAIRTAACTSAEDEQDLEKVKFNREIYEAWKEGYLREAGSALNSKEISMLEYSAVFMTSLIGLRFLTDYLLGDTYYHTAYPGHNLVRARVQLKLAKLMERQFEIIY